MCIIIKSMNLKDISQISKIEQICFSDPWTEKSLIAELSNNNSYFIVACIKSKIIGYAGMYHACGEGYITNIAVLPLYRKKGVGRDLLAKLIYFSKQDDFSFLSLEVRKSNIPAIKLYSSLGFIVVGERKNFYSHPTETAFIMTKYFTKNNLT